MFASTQTLLSSVVDYAGLFPPAKLDMQAAMANYAQYQRIPHYWMLGNFVLPASRLLEFEAQLPTLPLPENPAENPAEIPTRPWSLSLILSGNLASDLKRIQSITRRDDIRITALEFPPFPPSDIEAIFADIPSGVDAFFEISLSHELAEYLEALQPLGAAAKIRTGGLTAEAFPSLVQLGQFILACTQAQVSFKATAGLHHPLPAHYRLTYEADSLSTAMHGFLNVAIASACSYLHKVTATEILDILQEDSIEAFQFHADNITWRHHSLNLSEIEKARRQFFRSFGSCSFQEPVDDLKRLKLLS